MAGISPERSLSGIWRPAPSAFNFNRGNSCETRLPAHVAVHHRRLGSRRVPGPGPSIVDSRIRVESCRSLAAPLRWRRHLDPSGRENAGDSRRVVDSAVALLAPPASQLDGVCRGLPATAGPIDLSLPSRNGHPAPLECLRRCETSNLATLSRLSPSTRFANRTDRLVLGGTGQAVQ